MFRVFAILVFLSGFLVANLESRAAPPPGTDWVPTFFDEFNGTALDGNAWTSGRPSPREEPTSEEARETLLSDGILHLVTRHHERSAREWTTASVSPRKFRQRYGYAEIRLRFARTTGINNLVMLTTEASPHAPLTEIVIVEGRYPSGIAIKMTGAGGHLEPLSNFTSATDFSAGYHVFGLSWLPDGKGSTHLVWYLDGALIYQADCAACNQSMRLWIGTHVTTWAGPFAPVADGASMDVDYVRVYQDRTLMPPR
jgi:beta-glucanase (GH16 family)